MVLEVEQMVEEVGQHLLSERMLLEWQQRSVVRAIGRPLSILLEQERCRCCDAWAGADYLGVFLKN
jgi:hypothetical protein